LLIQVISFQLSVISPGKKKILTGTLLPLTISLDN
jgi:hypothetical protein